MAERQRPSPAPRGGRAGETPRSERERAALAELVEVERAIAALEGRSVENAPYALDARRDAERRRADLEQIIKTSREDAERSRRRLPFKIVGAVVALGLGSAGALFGTRFVRAQLAVRELALGHAKAAAQPFEGRFAIAQTAVGDSSLVLEAAPGKCFVVVAGAAGGAARVRVDRTNGARESERSVGFCTCKREEVTLTISGAEPLATLVLEAPAGAIGGADVLAALAPHPDAMFAETLDRSCAEAAFDAWAPAHHAPPRAPEELSREEKALVAQGLTPVAFAASDAPFVLPPVATEVCVLALSRGAGDTLSLRRKGGERPLTTKHGGLGFCLNETAGASVWRGGSGEVVLFSAPRARIGGALGLREAAARARVSVATWIAPDELEVDARAALNASGINADAYGFGAKRGTVLSLSTDARSMLTASDAGPEVACRPALEVGAAHAFCVEARPGVFQPVGGLPPGVMTGPRPLWLPAPAKFERAELERSLDLLAFARRMTAEGFELTSLVGANLTPDGVTVTGRSREKEIIAITVSSAPPYVHTLSSAAPWTLAEPRMTPLAPSATLKLRATPRYAGIAKREFVVWRR